MIINDSLKILLVDDETSFREIIAEYLLNNGHDVQEASDGLEALRMVEELNFDIAFIDVRMPGIDGLTLLSKITQIRPEIAVVIFTGYGTMEMAIQAFRLGALDFMRKPLELKELDNIIQNYVTDQVLSRAALKNNRTKRIASPQQQEPLAQHQLVGRSKNLSQVRGQIKQVVTSSCDTILIKGETGTGKEVVAHEIHALACEHKKPFVAVSCPAIPDSLIESELFGHKKGSFTNATSDRVGYFELAHRGTLYLDEIADLSWVAQAKLLRVLETRKFRAVGSSEEKNVNVRVIAATNKSLEELIQAGCFRPDLYYRLNVFTIYITPLRDRTEDILPITQYFLKRYALEKNAPCKRLSPEVIELLHHHEYPGNVRELRNIIERAIITSPTEVISIKDIYLGDYLLSPQQFSMAEEEDNQECKRLTNALEKAKWNRRKAALILGMPYSTLRYKLDKYGINK